MTLTCTCRVLKRSRLRACDLIFSFQQPHFLMICSPVGSPGCVEMSFACHDDCSMHALRDCGIHACMIVVCRVCCTQELVGASSLQAGTTANVGCCFACLSADTIHRLWEQVLSMSVYVRQCLLLVECNRQGYCAIFTRKLMQYMWQCLASTRSSAENKSLFRNAE